VSALSSLTHDAANSSRANVIPDADCSHSANFTILKKKVSEFTINPELIREVVPLAHDMYMYWRSDEDRVFEECPLGVVTACVYLSIPQDPDLKIELLEKASKLLLLTSSQSAKALTNSTWPVSMKLLRKLHINAQLTEKNSLVLNEGGSAPFLFHRVEK
jgi:hypothetical protein